MEKIESEQLTFTFSFECCTSEMCQDKLNKLCTNWLSAISQAYDKDHLFFNKATSRRLKLNISELLNKRETSKCYRQISKLLCSRRKKKQKPGRNIG